MSLRGLLTGVRAPCKTQAWKIHEAPYWKDSHLFYLVCLSTCQESRVHNLWLSTGSTYVSLFLVFSSPPSTAGPDFMQLRKKLRCRTKCIMFHNLVSLSAYMTKLSNLESRNHLPQESACLSFMDPRRWTATDKPKPFWTALIFQLPGKKHNLTTLFSAPQMWWSHFTHSVQHLQKSHKNTGRNADVLHIKKLIFLYPLRLWWCAKLYCFREQNHRWVDFGANQESYIISLN